MVAIKKTMWVLVLISLIITSVFTLSNCGNDEDIVENQDSQDTIDSSGNLNTNGSQTGSSDNTDEKDSDTESDSGELNFILSEDKDYYILTSLGNYGNPNVIIPGTYQGLDVKAIANNAFWGYDIVSVVIPDSITSIGASAFSECINLESVTIGSGIISIGTDAFSQCVGLQNVYIKDISKWCEISFESSSSNPLCYADNLNRIKENGESEVILELVIPNNVERIEDYAFYNGKNIFSVTKYK